MKTVNLVTVSMILTMLSIASVNFANNDGEKTYGRGSSQLSRFQPWSPGWVRPNASATSARASDKELFRVEPVRSPSTI